MCAILKESSAAGHVMQVGQQDAISLSCSMSVLVNMHDLMPLYTWVSHTNAGCRLWCLLYIEMYACIASRVKAVLATSLKTT